MSSFPMCLQNCSGHGICQQSQCQCLVQYSGRACQDANALYYLAFGALFEAITFVTILQLLLCILSEYRRSQVKSVRSACGVTVQKLLYILVICASSLRGASFFTKWHGHEYVSWCLWCAYAPFLITGFSLIICSWAEDVHVQRGETPRFLSKSAMVFVLFNVSLYLVVCALLVVTDLMPSTEDFSLKAYNGAVAVLFIIMLVIFLIYGVELYFKIHGAFARLEKSIEVDPIQVAMSRLGLVSQALLQFLMGLFLVADILADQWKNTLSVLGQNYYELVCRVVEFGVVLWFPCVLWNYRQPEKLWVLNPRRILRSLEIRSRYGERRALLGEDEDEYNYKTFTSQADCVDGGMKDCWICYDPDRTDAGCLIQPCLCRGDVSTVHHDCLHKWIVQSSELGKTPKCKICKQEYRLQRKTRLMPRGFGSRHLGVLVILLVAMLGTPVASYFVCQSDLLVALKILIAGSTVLFELFALKLLGMTIAQVYKRVQVASMKILGKKVDTKPAQRTPSKSNSGTQHIVSPGRAIQTTSSSIRTCAEIHGKPVELEVSENS